MFSTILIFNLTLALSYAPFDCIKTKNLEKKMENKSFTLVMAMAKTHSTHVWLLLYDIVIIQLAAVLNHCHSSAPQKPLSFLPQITNSCKNVSTRSASGKIDITRTSHPFTRELTSTMSAFVLLSCGSLYSVYLSRILSISVLAYWNNLVLELKMISAISQSHKILSSYAFFISPNLRLVKVT